ncbi:MAG: trehalose-6-phosphate synthase [Allosphingosinicella sp.]|uniref:alpha,alpha-trehalose-phosphate synthase (UDP-forming) n=1 Tax=Allosphingosinicella sp. TaxID=2823234 RepID=UPI00391FE5BD
MGRLVVVSNRVTALDHPGGGAAADGLTMAISSELHEKGGLWFGWSGEAVDQFTGKLSIRQHGRATLAMVDLDRQDVEEYHNGFAARTLWPLCHYRIDLAAYERSFSAGYQRVNERLAHALRPFLREDDLIWVHDYHLIPLAGELRKAGVRNRIGFFLHIPWPPADILATLPRHHEFVRALFDYDLVGFQTEQWLKAFCTYVRDEIGGTVEPDGRVTFGGQTTAAGAFPMGIDVDQFRRLALTESGKRAYREMVDSAAGRAMIVSVDRIDPAKGLDQKFAGYEHFLAQHDEAHGRVFMLQIGQPRLEDPSNSAIRQSLEASAGRINGAYGTRGWVPLRYITSAHDREELAGIFRAARAALVTPLRDGMNLVAKEYVAAQDPDDPGVLILSRFAGAAVQMRQALLVNPYSREDVADAIARALAMPRSERIARWQALFDGLVREDLAGWRKTFLAALAGAPAPGRTSERPTATIVPVR